MKVETKLEPVLLSVLDVAAYLRCSKTTIYEMIKNGDFVKPYRLRGVDKRTFFKKSDIDAYVARLPVAEI